MVADCDVFVERQHDAHRRRDRACDGYEFQSEMQHVVQVQDVRLQAPQQAGETVKRLLSSLGHPETVEALRGDEYLFRTVAKARKHGAAACILGGRHEAGTHAGMALESAKQGIGRDLRATLAQGGMRVGNDKDVQPHALVCHCEQHARLGSDGLPLATNRNILSHLDDR